MKVLSSANCAYIHTNTTRWQANIRINEGKRLRTMSVVCAWVSGVCVIYVLVCASKVRVRLCTRTLIPTLLVPPSSTLHALVSLSQGFLHRNWTVTTHFTTRLVTTSLQSKIVICWQRRTVIPPAPVGDCRKGNYEKNRSMTFLELSFHSLHSQPRFHRLYPSHPTHSFLCSSSKRALPAIKTCVLCHLDRFRWTHKYFTTKYNKVDLC